MIPTHIVIPIVPHQRVKMTADLVSQVEQENLNFRVWVDSSDLPLTEKWNLGWNHAKAHKQDKFNVLFLNNDIILGPRCITELAKALRGNGPKVGLTFPDMQGLLKPGTTGTFISHGYAQQTITGYAFMVRGELDMRFDEQFEWWYADTDIEWQMRERGLECRAVADAKLQHLHPAESSMVPERAKLAREDEVRFARKWGLDPNTLWLASHPDFGAES
jgi:GT2 family glycosyltransferase